MQRRDFDPAQATQAGSLVGLMQHYLTDLERRNYSADTLTVRRRQLRAFADWCAERGVTGAAQVTRAMVERYQRWLFAQRQDDGRPLSVGYQIQRVKPIQMLYRWAVRRHLVGANPAADLDYPRPIRQLPPVLSPEEAERVLAQPDPSTPVGLRDRALLEVLYSTGIRRMECARLRQDDLDHRRGLLRVVQGKGKKDRLVPIGARALDWVARYDAQARPLWHPDPTDRTLFLSPRGAPLARDALTALVRGYVSAAGLNVTGSCHLFRHSMATALHRAGCDVRVLQEMLGHAKLDTTALYTHVGVAHLKAAHAAYHPAANATDADQLTLLRGGSAAAAPPAGAAAPAPAENAP